MDQSEGVGRDYNRSEDVIRLLQSTQQSTPYDYAVLHCTGFIRYMYIHLHVYVGGVFISLPCFAPEVTLTTLHWIHRVHVDVVCTNVYGISLNTCPGVYFLSQHFSPGVKTRPVFKYDRLIVRIVIRRKYSTCMHMEGYNY